MISFLSIFTKIIGSVSILITILISLWYLWYYSFQKHLKYYPQLPNMVPIFGNALLFQTSTGTYKNLMKYHKQLGPKFWGMLGIEPVLILADDTKLIEIIMSSPVHINKSRSYNFFHRWLGQGLLTSTGQKWRSHRKIITPAFHFKILEEFVDSFESMSDILVKKLMSAVGKETTDIYPYMTLYTLDAVCVSAMGTFVNAQNDENSMYVKSVKELSRIVFNRTIRILENFEITYRFTNDYRIEKTSLKILHEYTRTVIEKRKIDLLSKHEFLNPVNEFGVKRRVAFLDLLLQYNVNGDSLSDEEIREEVDTFMFEGHDTTASALSFALYLLANNPDIQEKTFEELKDIFGNDKERKITFNDLHNMKYLELVIKETLRMYPSVPLFLRQLHQNIEYDGVILPKGLTVLVAPFLLHTNEKFFPDPNKFDPNRFLSKNTETRNPYSYLPFSAGPRNCIGQKFAMLAMKTTLSKILWNFQLSPVKHKVVPALEAILKSKTGIRVQIKNRIW